MTLTRPAITVGRYMKGRWIGNEMYKASELILLLGADVPTTQYVTELESVMQDVRRRLIAAHLAIAEGEDVEQNREDVRRCEQRLDMAEQMVQELHALMDRRLD